MLTLERGAPKGDAEAPGTATGRLLRMIRNEGFVAPGSPPQLLAKICKRLPIFGGLVLGCIEAEFCN